MKRAEHILAIDQGTTGTTVLAFDRTGRLRARGYAELPQHFPRPGWVEHRGEEIWETTLGAMRAALRPLGGARAAIAAIGLTKQRETTLLWDRATGTPVAPAIVWQDRRTAERCAQLRRDGGERSISKRTGLRLDPYFSATKLEWLLRHTPGVRARARRGALACGPVDSWLVGKLFVVPMLALEPAVHGSPSLSPPWHTFEPAHEPAPPLGQSASTLQGPFRFVPALQVLLHTGQTWIPGAFGKRSPSR